MRSQFLRQKVSTTCAVTGATILLSGGALAQNFVAADGATNAIYAAGWSAGQNGGYGFTAWDFSGTSPNVPLEQGMTFDHSSRLDAVGTAWTLFNPTGPGYGWISVAGRGFAPLQPYQTVEIVLDNPTNVYYGDGYTVELASGTANTNTAEQVSAYTYGFYDELGEWLLGDYYGNSYIGLNVTDTAPGGAKIDLTVLPAGNYQFTMTPLNDPTNTQILVGSMKNSSLPANWMQFEFYNNETNSAANDFFVSSMTISGPTLNIQLGGTNTILTWLNVSGYLSSYNLALESSTNLGPAAVWNPVSPSPAVVNGQNVVTNPIAGAQQFYRLYYP
jgi:hypothetical protein